MENPKKNPTTKELKAKYGVALYQVSITVPEDDNVSREYTYRFKRPGVQSYDRYVRSAAKVGITKASVAFMLDCVIDEDRDKLTADMEKNPGISIMIGNKLTEIMGLSDTVNLTAL